MRKYGEIKWFDDLSFGGPEWMPHEGFYFWNDLKWVGPYNTYDDTIQARDNLDPARCNTESL